MSRTGAVIRREFTEHVRSRAFLIGTVLGPLLMIGLFALQFLIITRSGGGMHRVVIADATGADLGEAVAAALEVPRPGQRGAPQRNSYEVAIEPIAPADIDEARARLEQRVLAREIDGFLMLPPDVVQDGAVRYEGENATNSSVVGDLRAGVQRAVQLERLAAAGIRVDDVEAVFQPVTIDAVKTGGRGAGGSAQAAVLLAAMMGFIVYLAVMLYGATVMNGVVEEKRDRIVELIVSSIRAQDLMLGKVVGIGAAGLLQMAIWIAAAALLLTNGAAIAGALGFGEDVAGSMAATQLLPRVPASVGVVLLLFFAAGFFAYMTLYAVVGALATTTQEAQQLVFPLIIPLILGVFMLMPSLENPEGKLATVGSFVPLTSPIIMPARHAMIGVSYAELAIAFALLVGFGFAVIWIGAKIYRIGIFATGKRATPAEVWRWIRTA
jgi:ABC-2 type transport system permease protein